MEYLEFQTGIFGRMESALGRFPFNKNYRFKFSEFSLVEWNASDRFPGFVVTCPATQGMLGDHLLCLKIWAKAKTWFNNMAKRREQNYWRAKVEGSVIRSKLKKKNITTAVTYRCWLREVNCCIDAAETDLCRSPQNHTQSIDMQLRPPFLRMPMWAHARSRD